MYNSGLNNEEVINNRKKYGNNSIFHKNKSTFFSLIIESLSDPIIKILLVALGIKLLFLFNNSDMYEVLGIVLSILIASLISSLSEYSSNKAFDVLMEENSKIKCKVLRNGKVILVDIDDIVVDDIVILEDGDKVPADGLIVEGKILLDESSLTGESKEQYKETGEKIFRGTVVIKGKSKMLVKVVGNNTSYGRIAESVLEKNPESPLKSRLKKLALMISKFGYISAFIVVLSYLFNTIVIANNFEISKILYFIKTPNLIIPKIIYALTLCVTIIIVAVPEGLPMMITLVLSSNMKRMLKNNVLVKKLVGIETSGSLNILYTDKTGTLTTGNLDVMCFLTPENKCFKKYNDLKVYKKYFDIIEISLIYNNDCYYENNNIIGGNSTDKSIVKFIGNLDRSKYKLLENEYFDSNKKYSSILVDYDEKTYFFKGAYEKILSSCNYYYDLNGNTKILFSLDEINKNITSYVSDGYRVLAVASGKNKVLENLSLIGFIVMKDEVRKDAMEGIKLVKNAGIHTVMITGDALDTAISVGKELNMINENSLVLTSEELNHMTDEKIKEIIPNLSIVARSMPQDKNKLIILSQELGLTVGMTGDGVNDAPALKKSDVGFAMGSGTEVAKEASDIVILDDNFLSISKAILFGRTVFKSIRKFIIFQLSVNICAVLLSVIGPFIGIMTPITVVQMLWVNMVMDTLAGIAFAYEPPLIEYMNEKPKQRNENIMNKYMLNQIICDGIYTTLLCIFFLKSSFIQELFRIGNNNMYLMTAFFGLFIFSQIFNSFNARTHRLNIFANILKNKAFLLIVSFICLVQVLLIYFGGEIFRTTGLTIVEFQIMFILSFTVIPFDFIRKLILKLFNKLTGV